MNWKSILQFISWVLGLFAKKPDTPGGPIPQPPTTLPPELGLMLNTINLRRIDNGHGGLLHIDKLMAAAAKHADWMAKNEKMSHEGEGGSRPAERIKAEGYLWKRAGENIAMGYTMPKATVEAWMKSPGHRANILGNYEEIGVGHAISSNGRNYWVAVFATPFVGNRAETRVVRELGGLSDVVESGGLSPQE